jgi:iron complex outermembrane receptor protein
VANWVVRLAIPFLRGRTTLTLHNTKYRLLAGAALSGIIMSIVPTPAIAEQSSVEQAEKIEIPASSLDVALKAYSAQTGTALLFSQAVIADKSSPGLSGTYPPREGLSLLLAGTDLEAVRGEGNAYLVREKQTDPDQSSPVSVQSEKPDVIPDTLPEPDKKASSDDLIADKVIVTGTSLRGFAPESSPLFVYGREEILESGAASTEEFIRQLPQNFGGGSTEFAPYGIPGDDSSKFNNTFGSGANLRGLGSGATLTLVNGRRLAPTSSIGDFVDLSHDSDIRPGAGRCPGGRGLLHLWRRCRGRCDEFRAA